MKKVRALYRYEMINLVNSKIFWGYIGLFLFGLQQMYSALIGEGRFVGGVSSIINFSWLPINLIMLPLMIILYYVGKSRNEIIDTLDLSIRERLYSKLLVTVTLNLISLILVIFLLIYGGLSSLSPSYKNSLLIGFIVSYVITITVISLIGLTIGEVLGNLLPDIINIFFIIVVFGLISSFYKMSNSVLTLYDSNFTSSILIPFKYDMLYKLKKIFWISTIFSLILIIIYNYYEKYYKKTKPILIGLCVLFIAFSIVSVIYSNKFKAVNYDIVETKEEMSELTTNNTEYYTFYGNSEDFYVKSYDMDLNLKSDFKNKCNMKVVIKHSGLKEIELGLFGKLNVNSVRVNGKQAYFERGLRSFKVKLPNKYNKDEVLDLDVEYSGYINTLGINGNINFFSEDNLCFLADVFEWYPKLNDGRTKHFTVKVNHSGKLYSNLKTIQKKEAEVFKGEDVEIFFLSANVKDIKHKGVTMIGNEEYLNDYERRENAIKNLKSSQEINKKYKCNTIIFAPSLVGQSLVDISYKDVILDTKWEH
ncbi:hypothetical protein ACOAKC_12455 [Hathewaya histolytica]|uniref:hypothetical protein n=1 Tax=Hathewaya histolytica TaxID=1498 RepID=UPI003B6735F8